MTESEPSSTRSSATRPATEADEELVAEPQHLAPTEVDEHLAVARDAPRAVP